jgi:Beta-ketoacyl synthase, N-terminal domain
MPEDRELTAPATLLDMMRDRAERYRDKVAATETDGADGPSAFWRLLSDGVDAITETPLDRWGADASGNANTRWGGFLDQVDQFDRFALVNAHACQRNQRQVVRQSKAGSALRMRAMAHCCHGGQRMVVLRSSR